MLTQKKDNKTILSTVKKAGAKIIKLDKEQLPGKKGDKHLIPALNEFNTGYIKGKDIDPL